uniref:Uncharacterized protein n=1 Tax=Fagus sylvatica TaxID=28930 RepID=A0A2N9GVL7_FAGSY
MQRGGCIVELCIPFLWGSVGASWSGAGSFVRLAELVRKAFFRYLESTLFMLDVDCLEGTQLEYF